MISLLTIGLFLLKAGNAMLERHNKINTYLFYFLISVELLIIILLSFRQHPNISFKNELFLHLNNDWTYVDDLGVKHIINLPTKLTTGSDHTVIISRRLPNTNNNLHALSILSDHQDIYAYLGGELLYTKVTKSNNSFLDVPSARMWVIIPLPSNCAGKTITLKIKTQYDDYAGKINEVFVGSKSALIINFLNFSGINLVLAIITLISGITAIITHYVLKKFLIFNRSIRYLGWFLILASLWMIMESNLTQIFMGNEAVISALTYLSLMTLPIPILLYITLIENYHFKRTAYCLTYIFTGSAFMQILLQYINILDFHRSIIIVKFEILLLFGVVFITLISELLWYKNKEIKAFTISAGILFIFGIIELFTYKLRAGINTGDIFQLGFLLFIIILVWDALKRFAKTIKLSESAYHYKFLATRDLLTNCRNRVAYAQDLDRISLDRNITIFLADMNNMKAINDTYGHHIGDEVIALCSQCLLKIFGRRVYRIGGDEFVCIGYDLDQKKIDSLLEDFNNECKTANEDIPYTFRMSVGYAVYDQSIDKSIYDTVKRADKNMYDNKVKMKE